MTKITSGYCAVLLLGALAAGCSSENTGTALVRIHNDFNNPEMTMHPPWTICESSYRGVGFGKISLDASTMELEVPAGLDNVLMVAAWDDPDCNPENCLPIASRNAEETVDGQSRTIHINLMNHQGPCPPEGVAPIPEELYNRILELWPEYDFLPYAQRTENTQCL